jgi:hypothetical protein
MELAEASRRNLAAPNGVNDASMRCHSLRRRRGLRNCRHLDGADGLGRGSAYRVRRRRFMRRKLPFIGCRVSRLTTQSEVERMPFKRHGDRGSCPEADMGARGATL